MREVATDSVTAIRADRTNVVPLPVDPHVFLTRQTARELEELGAQAAGRFWKETCRRLRTRLRAEGLDHEAVEAEIERFALAVHREMQIASWAKWQANRHG